MKKAYLLFGDNTQVEGWSLGAEGTVVGELVFHTALTGYPEIFTDPSYWGQILIMTLPHIGNYGTTAEEWQWERPAIRGLVVRQLSHFFSRPGRALGLPEYLRVHGIPVIAGVDTRALVRRIRQQGAQNVLLTTETPSAAHWEYLRQHPTMEGLELASSVTTPKPYTLGEPSPLRVAVIDFGVKKAILHQLVENGAYVGVFPATTTLEALRAFEPVGFLLSNGPGDPAAMPYAIRLVQALMEWGYPILGICLGHQLLALAAGIPTYKLRFGHRGSNHPVRDQRTGRLFITSQNHGFAISFEALSKHPDFQLTHINLNDHTVEGFSHRYLPIRGVQYHPEAAPGPHDSREIFQEFLSDLQRHLTHVPASS